MTIEQLMASTSSAPTYPAPIRGASLMLAFRPQHTLILGSNRLATTRAFSALEAGSTVTILARCGIETACDELRWRAAQGELDVVDLDSFSAVDDAAAFEAYLERRLGHDITLLFVTDTLISNCSLTPRSKASARKVYDVAHRHSIAVNTADMPELCDFTVNASHRFKDTTTGEPGGLQVGVTTNGQGCRLGSRLRREIVANLPKDIGAAPARVGELRQLAKIRDQSLPSDTLPEDDEEVFEETEQSSPNRPVEQLKRTESEIERTRRRMRWVAQVSEYWSFPRLAALSHAEMLSLLDSAITPPPSTPVHSQHDLDVPAARLKKEGRVLLVGSGPGHPSLLSLAAHAALTSHADVVLTDKLVPSAVLELIPPHIPTVIARKFPGNADRAQEELLELALQGAREGKTVVRLKQGDPALYGRVGEEVLFLRKHGIRTLVIPGISSALAAPLLADIPVTQRGAADSLVVCTGVGRGGKKGGVPPYERARTLVLLMGNARLGSIVTSLMSEGRYPGHLPAAIIERASMPDQRVLTSRLDTLVEALDSLGEQRPPGLLVVGWAVLSLADEGHLDVLDEEEAATQDPSDEARTLRWLGNDRWRVEEGLNPLWNTFSGLDKVLEKGGG